MASERQHIDIADNPLRVLLIGDNEEGYAFVRDLLSEVPALCFELDRVAHCGAALKEAARCHHNVYLLDDRIGGRDGLGLLREMITIGCTAPIIFLSGKEEFQAGIEAIRLGAADYLIKSQLTAPLLERAVRYAIERKHAEEALRESEERFRFLAENTGDVLYRLRYDTMHYDYLSPAVKTLTGYSPEEIHALGFSKLVLTIEVSGDKHASLETIKQDRKEGRAWEYRANYLIRTKGGESKWLRDHSFPWFDKSGGLVGSVGILSDITDQKQAEEAMRESEKQLRFLSAKLLTVQEEERSRLAQQLHDSIGQTLVAIKFGVENIVKMTASGNDERVVNALKAVVQMNQNAIEEIRRLYMDLRPTVLDDFGIIAAIGWFCREFEEMHPGIRVEKRIDISESDVPRPLKIVIYRVVQEAMDNIVRHSGASQVNLSLVKKAGNIELTVGDDGQGFDLAQILAEKHPKRGLGLASMKERTELAGGIYSIESTLGKGTAIRASWPVAQHSL